jgi:phenylalanyl-tRNA synthetase beta chain
VLVPLSWISDFAPFGSDAPMLADTLDDLGLVVEGVRYVGEGLGDVVVARVLEIDAIAGADKIRRVVVDRGDGAPVEVVCGAWNFAVGDLVPLAPVGAVLPGGFEIGRRRMKGVTSNGMLCSGRELELSDDHEGILVLGGDGVGVREPGTPLLEALGIERDVVFDVAVEANRPDAWSMAGIARDLAARLRLPFAIPEPADAAAGERPTTELTTITVVDDDLCPRFCAAVLTGVRVGPSPGRVARRVTLAGMRPINNVVDASNYVMLELGQPTHPYDLDRVDGGGLRIRAARPAERVTTLDGVDRLMGSRSVGPGDDRRDCLICDAGDAPIGIAGIMGGASTEIGAGTTRVLLEAAYFDPMSVARTSKRLSLRTEASARFERGCDPEGIDRAVARFAEIVAASDPGTVRLAPGVVDVRGPVPVPPRLRVRLGRVNAVLGSELDEAAVTAYLEPIGFRAEPAGDGVLEVIVPSFRPDSTREIDVIEEVARHHGYSNLSRRRPHSDQVGALSEYQHDRRRAAELAAGLGADEAWTSSFVAAADHERVGLGPGGVRVANPITPDEPLLRRSLLPGLLRALKFNADRRQDDVRLFEIGAVFPPPGPDRVARALARHPDTVVDEREHLAVLLAGPDDDARSAARAWDLLADGLGIVGTVLAAPAVTAETPPGLHPTRSARIVVVPGGAGAGGARAGDTGPIVVGAVGEVDPAVVEAFDLDPGRQRVGWLEVDLGRLLREVPRRPSTVSAVSRFPSSDIDLALVVGDAVAAAAVASTLWQAGGELLESVRLFDVYRGPGLGDSERSLAYRLRFCAVDRTLTDEEVGRLRARCIAAVEEAHGAVLRG